MRAERMIVRAGIPALLVASCTGAAAVSWHVTKSEIPTFAFGSHVVLAVQITLLLFYGALLLLVPVARALFDGALSVELSLKGARWREGVVQAGDELLVRQAVAEENASRVEVELRAEIRRLNDELKEADKMEEAVAGQLLERIIVLEKRSGAGSPGASIDRDDGRGG